MLAVLKIIDGTLKYVYCQSLPFDVYTTVIIAWVVTGVPLPVIGEGEVDLVIYYV